MTIGVQRGDVAGNVPGLAGALFLSWHRKSPLVAARYAFRPARYVPDHAIVRQQLKRSTGMRPITADSEGTSTSDIMLRNRSDYSVFRIQLLLNDFSLELSQPAEWASGLTSAGAGTG